MLALLFGFAVGISLGLTGSGGSIFAVPLLVFGLGMPLRPAVTISLAVVGLTALLGACLQSKNVRWLAGVIFGAGGILGAPLGAYLGARANDTLMLLLFSALMIYVAVRMLRGADSPQSLSRFACKNALTAERKPTPGCVAKLISTGILTGALSGAFGVGGGFLIVPALLLVTAMPVASAMATSLVAIFLISLSGFFSNLVASADFGAQAAAVFLIGSALGMGAGVLLKARLPQKTQRIIFAALVFAVALWTIAQTLTARG
jgi:uncharacterized membrane protein YfcA